MSHTVKFISEDEYKYLLSRIEFIATCLKSSPASPQKKWLTLKETLKLLGISQSTLWKYRDQRKIKASKIEGKLYFNREDIEKLLQTNHSYKD